ncbi:MAG: cobalamin-independent methionine synthase II family protein [Chloroflexi bacterium]|nr:cobalamin-independent methionine synthase II family protein [Chloroflexota bacterium]
MKRSTDRILTTHVGSLPVPPDLDPTAPDYEARLRATVAELVRKQAEIGIDVVSDGEASKGNWLVYAASRLGGFEPRRVDPSEAIIAQGRDREEFAEFYEEATRTGTLFHSSWGQVTRSTWTTHWVATGPITYTGQAAVQRDIANLQAALQTVQVAGAFLPVTAPASLEPYRSNAYYPSETAFLYALADALREEYTAIARAGLLVQIDDAWTVALWDRIGIPMGLAAFKRRALQRAEVLNHALAGIPQEQIRYHICWGSWHGPHAHDLPMNEAVDLMLAVNAGAYSFEAANVRHEHEYHVWERVRLPEGKVLIPGVVTHSTNLIEHPELVSERIQRFARLVGRENVIAGTDCGFGGRIHPQLAWAKLGALVEGARRATRALGYA